jgi:hypothetical protein
VRPKDSSKEKCRAASPVLDAAAFADEFPEAIRRRFRESPQRNDQAQTAGGDAPGAIAEIDRLMGTLAADEEVKCQS